MVDGPLVSGQFVLPREAFPADSTDEGPLPGVTHHVDPQVVAEGKAPLTDRALVRPLTCVKGHVSLKIRPELELTTTLCAAPWPKPVLVQNTLLRVRRQVLVQLTLVLEMLHTNRTDVMDGLLMLSELGFSTESFLTDRTLKGLLSCMD